MHRIPTGLSHKNGIILLLKLAVFYKGLKMKEDYL